MDCSQNTSPSPLSTWFLPLLWWSAVTGLVLASSAAALRSASATRGGWCSPAKPRLLQLHVQTLRLRPNGGQRSPYAMRGPTHLHVV